MDGFDLSALASSGGGAAEAVAAGAGTGYVEWRSVAGGGAVFDGAGASLVVSTGAWDFVVSGNQCADLCEGAGGGTWRVVLQP